MKKSSDFLRHHFPWPSVIFPVKITCRFIDTSVSRFRIHFRIQLSTQRAAGPASKGENRRKAVLPLCYSFFPTRSVDGLHVKGFAGGGLPDHGRDDLIISVPVQHRD